MDYTTNITKILASDRGAGWGFVNQMTSVEVYHSQPWFPGITSSSVVGAAAAVDTSNVLYPIGGILLCLKKVKSKDTDAAIALFTCVGLILQFWQ